MHTYLYLGGGDWSLGGGTFLFLIHYDGVNVQNGAMLAGFFYIGFIS